MNNVNVINHETLTEIEKISKDSFLFIREYMKENKISYASLARSLGVSRQNIFNVLHTDSMRIETLLKICHKLNEIISIRT